MNKMPDGVTACPQNPHHWLGNMNVSCETCVYVSNWRSDNGISNESRNSHKVPPDMFLVWEVR